MLNAHSIFQRRAWVLWLCTQALCAAAFAQSNTVFEGQGTFAWEASIDGGSTWTRSGLDVPLDVRVVMVRASVEWAPYYPESYLNRIVFDGILVKPGAPTIGDRAGQFFTPVSGGVLAGTAYFGNMMKIGSTPDLPSPRTGSLSFVQPTATGGHQSVDPFHVFSFTLTLDGTPGDRVLGANFWVPSPWNDDQVFTVAFNPWSARFNDRVVPSTTLVPLTLHVLPAPGAWALLIGVLAGRGRRRRAPPHDRPASDRAPPR